MVVFGASLPGGIEEDEEEERRCFGTDIRGSCSARSEGWMAFGPSAPRRRGGLACGRAGMSPFGPVSLLAGVRTSRAEAPRPLWRSVLRASAALHLPGDRDVGRAGQRSGRHSRRGAACRPRSRRDHPHAGSCSGASPPETPRAWTPRTLRCPGSFFLPAPRACSCAVEKKGKIPLTP